MSLRHGVTAQEEHKLKTLIAKGVSWEAIVTLCHVQDERGNPQVPLLADVDLPHVKKVIFDPLIKKLEDAKKAGFKDIHAYEADLKKKAVAKKAAESKE